MRTKKIIKEIKTKLDSLTDETIIKAKKYDELINFLDKVKFKVKNSNLHCSKNRGVQWRS